MSNPSIDELRLDLAELRDLRERSTRRRVQDLLDLRIRRLETDITDAEAASEQQPPQSKEPAAAAPQAAFTAEIKTYAWDQSDNYVKLYVTEGLDGVGGLPADQISAEFTETSVRLLVRGLGGRNRELRIARLCDRIRPAESSARVKSDRVTLMLRKAGRGAWAFVTELERRLSEQKDKERGLKSKARQGDDGADPGAGLMSLMRQMYEDGDDEMKRTIAKAWTESQSKRAASD